jgi:hypothetical protein
VASLEDAVSDLRAALSEAAGGDGSDPAAMAGLREEFRASLADVRAALSATQDQIDALQGEIETLASGGAGGDGGGAALAALSEQVAALEKAREQDMAAQANLAEAAGAARRAATVSAALAEIDRAMTFGAPFAGAMETAMGATEVEPAEALLKAAQNGAPTRESLKARFPDAAYQAIQASLEQEAEEGDGGLFASVAARLEARVTGLPDEAVAGDSVPAKLSRARAELLNGDIDAAVATIQALPEAAQDAMAEWTEGARLRSDADVALREWRAAIKLDL